MPIASSMVKPQIAAESATAFPHCWSPRSPIPVGLQPSPVRAPTIHGRDRSYIIAAESATASRIPAKRQLASPCITTPYFAASLSAHGEGPRVRFHSAAESAASIRPTPRPLSFPSASSALNPPPYAFVSFVSSVLHPVLRQKRQCPSLAAPSSSGQHESTSVEVLLLSPLHESALMPCDHVEASYPAHQNPPHHLPEGSPRRPTTTLPLPVIAENSIWCAHVRFMNT